METEIESVMNFRQATVKDIHSSLYNDKLYYVYNGYDPVKFTVISFKSGKDIKIVFNDSKYNANVEFTLKSFDDIIENLCIKESNIMKNDGYFWLVYFSHQLDSIKLTIYIIAFIFGILSMIVGLSFGNHIIDTPIPFYISFAVSIGCLIINGFIPSSASSQKIISEIDKLSK